MIASKATHIGKVKKENQDVVVVSREGHFAILADGMGGHADGRDAAERLCAEIKVGYPAADATIEEKIEAACSSIERVNTELYKKSLEKEVTGTTLVMAFQVPGGLISVHIGDSRLYRFRDEKISLLTKDHSRTQELIDQGLIKPEDAISHPMKTHLTRAVGVDAKVTMDLAYYEAVEGDLYMLTSDGLKNDVDDDNISRVLSEPEKNLEQKAESLIAFAMEGKATDNITIALFELENIGQLEDEKWKDYEVSIARPDKPKVARSDTTSKFKVNNSLIRKWKWFLAFFGVAGITLLILFLVIFDK